MSQESTGSAEAAVAATTDSYGGPVSEEQLAEVYLPDGQDTVRNDGDDREDDKSQDPAEDAAADPAAPEAEPTD